MSQPVFLWVILPNRGGDLTSGINVLSMSYIRALNELRSSHARSGMLRNTCSQMDQVTSLTWFNIFQLEWCCRGLCCVERIANWWAVTQLLMILHSRLVWSEVFVNHLLPTRVAMLCLVSSWQRPLKWPASAYYVLTVLLLLINLQPVSVQRNHQSVQHWNILSHSQLHSHSIHLGTGILWSFWPFSY